MVDAIRSGDKTISFRELRLAADTSRNYRQRRDTTKEARAVQQELAAKNYAKAARDAEAVLNIDFVDIETHFAAFLAYRELGDSKNSDLHKFIFTGLLNSIVQDGDGLTTETAHMVITVHEEYVVLHALGVGLPKSQALIHQGPHSFDKIVYVDPDSNQEKTIFFNVDIPIRHETETFK